MLLKMWAAGMRYGIPRITHAPTHHCNALNVQITYATGSLVNEHTV